MILLPLKQTKTNSGLAIRLLLRSVLLSNVTLVCAFSLATSLACSPSWNITRHFIIPITHHRMCPQCLAYALPSVSHVAPHLRACLTLSPHKTQI